VTWREARAVLDDLWLKPRERLVLIALALRTGSDGRSWPSLARLSADTGYARSTVKLALKSLVRSGHLEVIHRQGRSSVLTLGTRSESDRVPGQISALPGQYAIKTGSDIGPRSKEEVDKKLWAPGTTPSVPAASNGKVNGGGPRPGETWGEYRERGGR
jgi:DNA-binding transcriptional MocR family regulator